MYYQQIERIVTGCLVFFCDERHCLLTPEHLKQAPAEIPKMSNLRRASTNTTCTMHHSRTSSLTITNVVTQDLLRSLQCRCRREGGIR
jgi:hypothetical protein